MEKSKPQAEEKRKKKLVLVIFLVIAILLFFFLYKNVFAPTTDPKEKPEGTSQQSEAGLEAENSEEELSPEDVLKMLEKDDSPGGNLELVIISPEEDTFMPGQARLWRAEFANIESDDSFPVECIWKFYLNQNNEEVLYKEQETRSGVSKSSPNVCGFTSTFIESRGELRAEVTAEVINSNGEIIQTYRAEKSYRVQ